MGLGTIGADTALGATVGGPWGAAIGAGIGLFGSIFGADTSANAQQQAATINAQAQEQIAAMNTTAQEYAANLTAEAAANSLAFSKAGAENTFQNSNVANESNYNQYAAAQKRIGSVGLLLGMGQREIPAFIPGVDPNFTGSSGSSGGSSGAPVAVTPDITAAALANYKTLGVSPTGVGTGPTDISYYAQQIANTGGLTPANTAYWFGPNGRIAQDLAKSGGTAGATPPPPANPAVNPYSVSQYVGVG
jgi:hypothetical protein